MKAFTVMVAAALALAGCVSEGLNSIPASPGSVASQTVLDEKGAIAVETAYTAAAKAAALAIRTGVVSDPNTVRRIGELDNRAYASVKATRAAYNAGNASSYLMAFNQANTAVKAMFNAF